MKCDEIQEMMLDVVSGAEATPVMNEHLHGCPQCAGKLAGMRQTMALLDEWQAPEPSPYFDTRLAARMREERAKPARAGWLSWFRTPALAGALALILMVAGGINLYNGRSKGTQQVGNIETSGPIPPITRGTAVGDLQALDKNEDLYANFDLLDDLQVQPDVDVDADQETP
jgi:predicted anti-sigma-YlaC factor YlaD